MSSDIIQYLQPIVQELEEIIQITGAENPEFDMMADIVEKWNRNCYPKSADESGIELMENALGLNRYPTDTLEDRRLKVIAKLNERLPFTEIRLRRMLSALCGWDGFELTIEDLVLTCYLTMESMGSVEAVFELLRDIVPMNVLFEIVQKIERYVTISHGTGETGTVELNVLPRQKTHLELETLNNILVAQRQVTDLTVYPRQIKDLVLRNQIMGHGYGFDMELTILPRQYSEITEPLEQTLGTGKIYVSDLIVKPRRTNS